MTVTAESGGARAELLLETCAISSVWAARDRDTGLPAGLWGIARLGDIEDDIGSFWMVAIEPLHSDRREVFLLSQLVLTDMLDRCGTLENYVDADREESIGLLSALGFAVAGAEIDRNTGRTLHYVSLTRSRAASAGSPPN